MVAWEQDVPAEAVTTFDRDGLFSSLYHARVPRLLDYDIVEYRNGGENVIGASRNAVQVLAALEGLGAIVVTAQEAHARSDYREE